MITDLSPPKSPMIVDRAVNTPRDAAEPPKVTDNGARDEGKDDRFCALGEAPRRKDKMVEHVASHEHGKVERWELVRVRRRRNGKGGDVGDEITYVRNKEREDGERRDVHSDGCRLRGP